MKAVLIGLLILSAQLAQAIDVKATEVRDLLAAYDAEYLTQFRLSAEVALPFGLDPALGAGSATLRMAAAEPDLALQISRTGGPPIRYSSKSADDLNPRGNQVTGYNSAEYILVEIQEGRIFRFPEVIEVDPQNRLVGRSSTAEVQQEVYQSHHADLQNQIYRYLLPLGRGFAQCLDSVSSVSVDGAGIMTVVARGKLFSPYEGTWNLTIDLNQEGLVRASSFTMDGHTEVDFQTSTTAPLAEGGKLASGGWIDFGGYKIEINGARYQKNSDPELMAVCRGMKDQPVPGRRTRVIDFTKINSHGVPAIRDLRSDQN